MAVAVRARTGGRPRSSTASPRVRNSGRKSWPHWLTQWASSTTNRSTAPPLSRVRKSGSAMRSGVVKTNATRPEAMACSASWHWAAGTALFTWATRTPRRPRWSAWSFMSAMSGLTTTVVPSISRAGNWKQRLLPDPVGMTTSVSRPSRTDCTASACPGRNRRNPKCCRSFCRSFSAAETERVDTRAPGKSLSRMEPIFSLGPGTPGRSILGKACAGARVACGLAAPPSGT